jgi:Domain of unknown function DUF29
MSEGADLYARDILLWSEEQADLLRRLARGEQVNGMDWDHVIEEIEDVARSELYSVQSYLRQALLRLLKEATRPHSSARQHWRGEITNFLIEAEARFSPSMARVLDLQKQYERALKQLRHDVPQGQKPPALPPKAPFTLEALLNADIWALEEQLSQAQLHTNRHVV